LIPFRSRRCRRRRRRDRKRVQLTKKTS